ncbi:AAA family ATPase [Acinetobacter sp.]|uniref:AAA family ATPase n=1 Tax=Acinetobacter sp. TaxID=472 RepID=UPI0037524A13
MPGDIREREIDTENAFSAQKAWSVGDSDLYRPGPPSTPTLPAGYYEVHVDYNGPFIQKQDLKTDELIDFSDSVGHAMIAEIKSFWTKEANFKKYGFLHRRGYLMHGPPGSGKTSLIQMVISETIKEGGVVFSCTGSPEALDTNLRLLRRIEPDRQLICIYEDIDAIVEVNGEEKLLSVLDGENLVDHVVNIATTNYLNKLDDRIRNRPRRFDRVMKIEMPSVEARRAYLSGRFDLDDKELEKWIKDTDGFSFAALADLVISTKCLENTYPDSLKVLKTFLKEERKGFNASNRAD